MKDLIKLVCLVILFLYSIISSSEIWAMLIGILILHHLNKSLCRKTKKIVYLSPPSEHHTMEWAESIIAVEKGLTSDMLQLLEKEPDLIYTANAAGETVLHVLAKANLGDAIKVFVCSRMMEIVQRGRMKRVLLKQNTDGDTPLHLALHNKDQKLVFWLVVVNAKAEFLCNKEGVYPYRLIEEAGYYKVLEMIPTYGLESGCSVIEMKLARWDINNNNLEESSKVRKWMDPIPKHARQAFLKAAHINRGKEIRWYIDTSRGNLLHWAANYGRVDLLQLLEKFTSKSELASLALERNKFGDLPLHLTLEVFNDKAKATAHYLIEVAPKAAFFLNRKGFTPLYLAIEQGREDLVRKIFRLTPGTAIDTSLRNNLLTKKASVAHAAVRCGNLGMFSIIMKEIPSSIDSLDEQGWRPLSYAAYEGYSFAVFYFLKQFPNSVNRYDLDGSFPIHKAVAGGHVSIVEQFLSSCPSTMYHLDNKGRSILHIAVSYGKGNVFSYLTKNKEVKEIFYHKDHEGKTFLDVANQLKIGRTNF